MKVRNPVLAVLALAVVVGALALPAFAAETKSYENVSLVDTNCLKKVKDDPDAHTRACALKCAGSGYGVLVDGQYLKFDAPGNEKAKAALEASSAKDHLRVNVSGELDGETLKVASLTLVE
ncbi:MAG: hypothetical protein ACREQY_06055 [Candidatus Binatia bacterium]